MSESEWVRSGEENLTLHIGWIVIIKNTCVV